MLRKVMVFFAAAAMLLGLAPAAHADTTVLKIGTLAPGESPWGQVFKVWAAGVDAKSNHALKLQFFWNAQQGDEEAMVGKIGLGQLDGAALTAVGLGKIYKQVLMLQLPGLFRDWAKLDSTRNAMKSTFDAGLAKGPKGDGTGGVTVLGWGDVGRAHVMSKGFAVRGPADLKHKNTYTISSDPIGPALFNKIGDVTPKPTSVTEILPGLTNGSINVVIAPALAAEQLQWSARLDNINSAVGGIGIGALVVSAAKLASLPPDVRAILVETGALAGAALTNRIRREDDAAYGRLAARMTVYTPNATEQAEWTKLFADTRTSLRGNTFDPAIFDKVAQLAQ